MANLFVSIISIIILILAPLIGVFVGVYIAKRHLLKQNRKIEENAIEVINGERENSIEIEGIKYDATKFKVRGKDGEEVIVAFGPKKEELKQQEDVYIPPKRFIDKLMFWKRKKPDEEIVEQVAGENTPTKTEEKPKTIKKIKPKKKLKKVLKK